jgi:hypothetical protein
VLRPLLPSNKHVWHLQPCFAKVLDACFTLVVFSGMVMHATLQVEMMQVELLEVEERSGEATPRECMNLIQCTCCMFHRLLQMHGAC